jgi:hypothetical protein
MGVEKILDFGVPLANYTVATVPIFCAQPHRHTLPGGILAVCDDFLTDRAHGPSIQIASALARRRSCALSVFLRLFVGDGSPGAGSTVLWEGRLLMRRLR